MKFSRAILETPLVKVHSSELITELANMKYKQYLATTYWLNVRESMHSIIGYKCEICGCEEDIQIHHFHYANRGKETLDDLACLCGRCHRFIHNSENAMIGHICDRKDFSREIKFGNKIKKKFSNRLYLKILPLAQQHSWLIQQIENLFECSREDFIKKFNEELKSGLIVKSTGVCGKETFEFYSLNLFAWNIIGFEYPKI